MEDAVAHHFRTMGFDVEPRVKMKDRFDISHEIDVLASRRETFGTIQVAIECKYVKTPIDIKEVRNFHDKLSALGITKGVFVSTGGFTVDAESHARALGIEIWDITTLQEKIAKEVLQKDVIHDALPLNPAAVSVLSPRHLKNFHVFSETLQLIYKSFHFVDYHCFSQHTVAGSSVVLESKGTVVLDDVTGQIVDSKVTTGVQPTLRSMGPYIGCIGIQPQTITSVNLPKQIPSSVIGPKLDSVHVKELVKIELVKNLTLECHYNTTRTSGWKLLKPRKKDIDILKVQPVKIPLYLGNYHFKNYTYSRMSLAALPQLVFDLDQTASCLQCHNLPAIVCENCGGIACECHRKNCLVCGKNLCSNCVISKGIISKKYYCTEHSST